MPLDALPPGAGRGTMPHTGPLHTFTERNVLVLNSYTAVGRGFHNRGRAWAAAVAVLGLALGSTAVDRAAAQAPPAPPQPAGPLRNLGGQLLEGLLKPQSPPALQKPLDYAAINDAIELILKPILAGDATLDALQLVFDPARTDLAKDTLRLTTVAGLRRSAWSSAPSRWQSDVTATADLQSPGGAKASLEAQVLIATDVVSLANFALQKYQVRNAEVSPMPPADAAVPSAAGSTPGSAELPPPAAAPALPKSVGQALLKDKLREMPRIATFDDLADAFQMIASLQFLAANEKIEQLKAQTAAAGDEVARAKLLQELVAARQQRDKAGDFRTRIVRDDRGAATAIYITLAAPQSAAALHIQRLDLVVQPGDIRLASQVQLTKGVEIYALLKPLIVGTLERLASRDPAAIEAQRGLVRGWLPRVRRLLEQGEL